MEEQYSQKSDAADPRRSLVELDSCSQYLFSPSIDRPGGRTDGAVSAVTGMPLRYFTPDSLTDLIARCQIKRELKPETQAERLLGLSLARAASKRGSGEEDEKQAFRLCGLITEQNTCINRDQLMALAARISPKAKEVREEIVFAQGPTAADATHIYAPHSVLPELMESIFDFVENDCEPIDPAVAVAVVEFFCIHAHPFLDGNGRWSRIVAGSIGMSHGPILLAMTSLVFQAICAKEIATEIWPESRSFGLRTYLESALKFEELFLARLDNDRFRLSVTAINSEIYRVCRGRRDCLSILASLYAQQEVDVKSIRNKVGLSARAFNGVLDNLTERGGDMISVRGDYISLERLFRLVDQAAVESKNCLMGSSCYGKKRTR